jgi:hypothetical protein
MVVPLESGNRTGPKVRARVRVKMRLENFKRLKVRIVQDGSHDSPVPYIDFGVRGEEKINNWRMLLSNGCSNQSPRGWRTGFRSISLYRRVPRLTLCVSKSC